MKVTIAASFLLLTFSAHAYEVRSFPHGGNSAQYYLESWSLSASQRNTITAAVQAWDAGNNEVLRGAEWSTTTLTLAGTEFQALNNGRDEISDRPDIYFIGKGHGGALATWFPRLTDADIVINSMYTWCTNSSSNNPYCRGGNGNTPAGYPVRYSLGNTMVHEMGHAIAFAHEDDHLATMGSVYPSGGDLADGMRWLPSEDDAAGLMAVKPGSSTGFNISVAKWQFRWLSTTAATASIVWETGVAGTGNQEYFKRAQKWSGQPRKASFIYHGTGGQSVSVHWYLSTNSTCTVVDYLVGTRTPTMYANTAYVIGPNSWNLASVPTGSYYLCAIVDPLDALSETLETDNIIVSRLADITVSP